MKTTKYAVDAFRFYKEFETEEEARACFEEVKNNFTYCELKKIEKTITYQYSQSIKIFRK
jgi:hypothetical protein